MQSAEPSAAAVAELLRSIGLHEPCSISRTAGGGNNRSFDVLCGERRFFLKQYYSDQHDPWDRLDTEYRFCRVAWNHGITEVPEPLACDVHRHLGLFQFIDGSRPTQADLSASLVNSARNFFLNLNRFRNAPDALELNPGSEAAFSILDHAAIVEKRVARLGGISGTEEIDLQARAFCSDQLVPRWKQILASTKSASARALAPLDLHTRCLSPTDF